MNLKFQCDYIFSWSNKDNSTDLAPTDLSIASSQATSPILSSQLLPIHSQCSESPLFFCTSKLLHVLQTLINCPFFWMTLQKSLFLLSSHHVIRGECVLSPYPVTAMGGVLSISQEKGFFWDSHWKLRYRRKLHLHGIAPLGFHSPMFFPSIIEELTVGEVSVEPKSKTLSRVPFHIFIVQYSIRLD